MLNALADLASRRARRIVVAAVVGAVVAGALGAGVASRLDPYGDDDPATESVQADERLEDAGYQELGVIALVRGVDVSSPETERRVESLGLADLRGPRRWPDRPATTRRAPGTSCPPTGAPPISRST